MQSLILLLISHFSITFGYFMADTNPGHTYADAETDCANSNSFVATIKSPDEFFAASKTCGSPQSIGNGDCWLGYIPRVSGNGWDPSDGSDIGDNFGFNDLGTAFKSNRLPWKDSQHVNKHIRFENSRQYTTSPDGAWQVMCNSCTSNSCINNGICIEEVEGFRCACDDNTECLNGGICIDALIDNNDFSCKCPDGFEGRFCTVNIDEVCPTLAPTNNPTLTPTNNPTLTPTNNPTLTPTNNPTLTPTLIPTLTPTLNPTSISSNPTKSPTDSSDDDFGDEQFSAALNGNLENLNGKESVENECACTDINLFLTDNLFVMIVIVVIISLIICMCLWFYCGQKKMVEYGVDDKVYGV